ncbi:DUF6452 family protein [Zunongwangia sp. F363]|uniref:DUF6452 family protein n=1 Tax=Autumnicola tepida TaxID=3075595 RepID=A0ABU3CAE2_9FLAO|nr:DUF6452 family protein [Zunongwangia sp. F363]MDT0643312.1 DUF6452 family protein [Zunongwangia sp. F363]
MIFRNRLFFGLLLMLVAFSGCQRDDICPESTQTTSLLIIRFYDVDDRVTFQSPTNLQIKAVGDTTVYTNDLFNTDSLAIPLRTDADVTSYEFTFNYAEGDDIDPDSPVEQNNTDTLTFSYIRDQEYLNRACSFKINYSELDVETEAGEDGAWIQAYQIEQEEVTNETEAHLSLYY